MDKAHNRTGSSRGTAACRLRSQITQISHDPAALHTEPPRSVKAVPMTQYRVAMAVRDPCLDRTEIRCARLAQAQTVAGRQ